MEKEAHNEGITSQNKQTTTRLVNMHTYPAKQYTRSQTTLFPSETLPLKKETRLTHLQATLLFCMDANEGIGLTINRLYDYFPDMHLNTISNFMQKAKRCGWVRELQLIKGEVVNTLYEFYKKPDYLENGQQVKDRRLRHYQITQEGKRICEFNRQLLEKANI
jgi:hypothetical protein